MILLCSIVVEALISIHTLHLNECHSTLFEQAVRYDFQIGFKLFHVILWHSSLTSAFEITKKEDTTMQARGPLMIEHRLIERMLSVIKGVLVKIELKHKVDPVIVDIVVDFIKVYADRTHHGKEEDILFRELNKKVLTSEDSQIMKELIDEHMFGRQTTKALVEANTRYRNGDETALTDIAANLKTLTEFYPGHIEKEDKVFFPSSRNYFTDEEDQAMLAEFWAFDRNMIHEKYKSLVEDLKRQQ